MVNGVVTSSFIIVSIIGALANNGTEIQSNSKQLRQEALNVFALNQFLRIFIGNKPNLTEFEDAETIQREHLEPAFNETKGIYGVLNEATVPQLKDLISSWVEKTLVTAGDATAMKDLLSTDKMFKTIQEHVTIKLTGEIVFIVTGFLQLQTLEDTPMGSVIYAFQRFKLIGNPDVTYSDEQKECTYWGIICKTNLVFDKDAKVSSILEKYMRRKAVRDFEKEIAAFQRAIQLRAKRLERFLPVEVKSALRKLKKKGNREKQDDQVLTTDPLCGNKYFTQ